jgi:arylsulfatase A-like enzyme
MKTFLNQFAGVTALFVVLLLTWASALSAADGPRSAEPNVIIIYTDDHGYTDLGLFGIDGNVDTPNMDTLASNGASMANGYCSAPQCRPSRVGLMAGRIQNEIGFDGNHANPGEGEGNMPRTYPAGTDMAGQPLLTIADRMKALGYVTGFSGKWHCGTNNDAAGKYDPRGRGFDEYWVGLNGVYFANFDLAGNSIPHQRVENYDNRVIVQGEAAEAFIERNKDKKFFLYFPIFGPHMPRIDLDDPYYTNFPVQDYPQYDATQDDVRRQGLALLKAMDDAIGGVVQKLRDLGLEESTLILFASDNGAPMGLRTGRGSPDVKKWNGSENVPMRGGKGLLMEGGIRVPMFAYWKGTIPAGQVIDEMVTTLDFTATTLVAGGGALPAEFDGVNILPRLMGQASTITRTQPMFWDFQREQAVRKGDWKLWRNASGDRLYNLAKDPYELTNLIGQQPERAAALSAEFDAWVSTLRADATAKLADDTFWAHYLNGAPAGIMADPRYRTPYDNPVATPYPAPVSGPPVANAHGAPPPVAPAKPAVTRDPYDANDLIFEFNTDGDFEGWDDRIRFVVNPTVASGFLTGQAESGQGKFENRSVNIDGSQLKRLVVRMKSGGKANELTLRWGSTASDKFDNERVIEVSYKPGVWEEVTIDLSDHPDWVGQTITRMRISSL